MVTSNQWKRCERNFLAGWELVKGSPCVGEGDNNAHRVICFLDPVSLYGDIKKDRPNVRLFEGLGEQASRISVEGLLVPLYFGHIIQLYLDLERFPEELASFQAPMRELMIQE